MKGKNFLFLIVVLATILFGGCAYQGKISKDGSVSAIGFPMAPTAKEISKAQINNSQAAINYAMAYRIKESGRSTKTYSNNYDTDGPPEPTFTPEISHSTLNNGSSELNFTPEFSRGKDGNGDDDQWYGIVRNNAQQPVWVELPDYPVKMKVEADSFLPIPLSEVPETITVYQKNGNYRIFNPPYKPRKYAGLNAMFVLYIDRVT